jgi:hypothetical protein
MWKRIDLRETSTALSGRRIERADHQERTNGKEEVDRDSSGATVAK